MLRRILFEKRRFVVLLGLALAVNIGVYAAAVYPLATRVADADNRAARADREQRAAEREYTAARGLATSRERAETELKTFYQDVLPADLSAANRLTYLSLAQLARTSNLRVVRRTAGPDHERGSGLDRLKLALVLEGSYEDMRRFIYRLETAPEFVIIDDVAIDQGREATGDLVLTLQLSTYYRTSGNAG